MILLLEEGGNIGTCDLSGGFKIPTGCGGGWYLGGTGCGDWACGLAATGKMLLLLLLLLVFRFGAS